MKFIPYYLGLSVLGLGISSPYAHAQDADHISNETLLKRIEELEQRLKVSERKDELDHAAAAEKANTAASVYEHTDFKGGSSNSVLAQDENVIMTRAQISF